MRTRLALLVLAAATLAAAPIAHAKTFTVKGANGAGPAKYDKTFVTTFGPSSAKRVLILVPGFEGGAGEFKLVAKDIAARLPGLQVWAWDRREQALEDTTGFDTGNPDTAQGYYLGGQTANGRKFTPVDEKTAPWARQWGMDLQLRDLRNVVRRARDGGRRKVVLGGHSFGASTAVTYSTWDFNGHAGWRDIAGLVLIDGGFFRSAPATAAQTQAALDSLATSNPFADLFNLNLPWATGVFAELSGLYALKAPTAPSALQDNPLIPSAFRPPFRVTNQGFLGFASDATTAPPAFALLQTHIGALAASGDPRPWVDGELGSVERLAQTFGTGPVNGAEWFFPKRLNIDSAAIGAYRPTATTRKLGLHPAHARQVSVPLYVFQTSLTNGAILKGAKAFVKQSRIKRAKYVDAPGFSHLDPVVADPSKNTFLKTVVPFLRGLH